MIQRWFFNRLYMSRSVKLNCIHCRIWFKSAPRISILLSISFSTCNKSVLDSFLPSLTDLPWVDFSPGFSSVLILKGAHLGLCLITQHRKIAPLYLCETATPEDGAAIYSLIQTSHLLLPSRAIAVAKKPGFSFFRLIFIHGLQEVIIIF